MNLIDVLFSHALIVPSLDYRIQELSDRKADTAAVPSGAGVNGAGLVTFQNSIGTALFTLQLPLYSGGVE